MENVYKDQGLDYLAKGLAVIPGKYGSKMPAIKGWSKYCDELPSEKDALTWINTFDKSNLDLCLGKASGIIALDLDCVDEEILNLIQDMLPESPVEKVGSKGWTRFFKYTGEMSCSLKWQGENIIEILSSGKKTTMPGSLHPNGMRYRWTSEETLLTLANVNELPHLAPMLFSQITSVLRTKFHDAELKGAGKVISGRNDELSSICGALIKDRVSLDEAVSTLVKHDQLHNDPPLFTDANERLSTEPFTNAILFYANHLSSVNNKRFRNNQEYEIPVTASAINKEAADIVTKKSELRPGALSDSASLELPEASGLVGNVANYILENSYIPQPSFALSAAIGLVSILAGRKFQFEGAAPNMYLLNVGESGSGKNAPQEVIKEIIKMSGLEAFLGSGMYVSDASLMDGLSTQPCRIDLIDEASALLKVTSSDGANHTLGMTETLCELYTSSTSEFLGRMLAGGERKGRCYRPIVSILGSTTPIGFIESISRTSLDKGLLGRFLFFRGDDLKPARRLKSKSEVSNGIINSINTLANYVPVNKKLSGISITQEVDFLEATPRAHKRLDEIFNEYDSYRVTGTGHRDLMPIVSRRYQQMVKLILVHAIGRIDKDIPIVDLVDVEFGFNMMQYQLDVLEKFVSGQISTNKFEKDRNAVLEFIKNKGYASSRDVGKGISRINGKYRKDLLMDLIDLGMIAADHITENGISTLVYKYVEE